jgi:hypothetical protein
LVVVVVVVVVVVMVVVVGEWWCEAVVDGRGWGLGLVKE